MNTYFEPKQEIKLAVDAVCFVNVDNNNYVLFIQRQYEPFKDFWALPGGFVKSDEELEDAAIRELREETMLKDEVKNIKEVGVFGKIGRDPRKRIISVAYKIDLGVKSKLPEISTANETIDIKWINLKDLSTYTFAFDHKEILDKAISA